MLRAVMGDGIVSAGDRAAGSARRLRPLPAYPPREVPSLALWSGSARATPALPLALAMTILGAGFAILWRWRPEAEIPVWFPVVFLGVAFLSWLVAAVHVRRARRLLEAGMPAKARITRVHVNLFVHSAGRSRTTVEYDWTFAGRTRHAVARGYSGRGDRGLVVGEELILVCDPSGGEEHLVPFFYGFRLDPF